MQLVLDQHCCCFQLPLCIVLHVQAGEKVVCVEDGLPTWVCELMVIKPTVDEAIEFIKQIETELDIPIDPASPVRK